MIKLFNFDALSLVMLSLISFIGFVVSAFSYRYLQGDRKYNNFFAYMIGVMLTIAVLVSADYLPLFVSAWIISNYLLSRLMLHKSEWLAARASANLALKNFAIGAISLVIASLILAHYGSSAYISGIHISEIPNSALLLSGLLLIISAMTQSAIWPFHRWLLSSLNSPTPVSAFMHAGLINGGGFLLARFAGIFLQQSFLLQTIFFLGAVSIFLGTCWKLIQHDVKRMLACSTMAQMGFMFAECGLGLFAAAVSHLIWHGMFKAYLFLNTGSAAREKQLLPKQAAQPLHLILALAIGILGVVSFTFSSNKTLLPNDTNLIINVLAWIACSQGALTILQWQLAARYLLMAIITSLLIGSIYGINLHILESVLHSMQIDQPQVMQTTHYIALTLIVLAWVAMIFRGSAKENIPDWHLKLYVAMLNASQPKSNTVTAHRNHYHY